MDILKNQWRSTGGKGDKIGSQGQPYLQVLIITKGIKSNPVTCHDFDSSPYTQKKMIKFENWQVSVSCLHKFQDPKGDKIGSQGQPYLRVLIITKGIKSNPVTCHDFDSSPYTQKKMIKFENWQVSVFVFEQAGSSLTDMAITVRNTQRFIPALCTVSRVAQNY